MARWPAIGSGSSTASMWISGRAPPSTTRRAAIPLSPRAGGGPGGGGAGGARRPRGGGGGGGGGAAAAGGSSPLRHQIPPQFVRLAHGRREARRRQPGRQPVEAGEAEREEVAALRGDERMQLVE